MKHVPEYMLPHIAPVLETEMTGISEEVTGFIPFKKDGIST